MHHHDRDSTGVAAWMMATLLVIGVVALVLVLLLWQPWSEGESSSPGEETVPEEQAPEEDDSETDVDIDGDVDVDVDDGE